MTTAFLAPTAKFKAFGNDGAPLVGGQLFTYGAMTSTPIATWTDAGAGTPNANPIILDSRGEANLWILPNTGYKFVLQDAVGNVIWTTDNIFNSQLLTLFGGVDSGAANAYVLNFNTPYDHYTDGEVIFFIPSSTNTATPAPTLNVNGLGPIPIVNIDGSAVGAGQIQKNQTTQVMYFNGVFQLISIGSITGSTIGTFGKEVAIASAATTDLGSLLAHVGLVTGTTTITSLGNSANLSAPIYMIRFASSLILTYNATSLQLPTNANIVTQPGDAAIAQFLGNGNWKVNFYQTSAGGALTNVKIKPSDTAISASTTLTPDPDLQSNTLLVGRYNYELFLIFDSVLPAAGFKFTKTGGAVDSRGVAPALASGFINGAAYVKTDPFYGITVSYTTVSSAANSNTALYTGSLLVSTPGTFGISWAQVASDPGATTLRAGSYLAVNLLTTGTTASTVLRIYSTAGSGTETVPAGYTTVTIEIFGGSGNGGSGNTNFTDLLGGGGGGSGGYAMSQYSVGGLGGRTMAYSVGGVNGASTVSSGTLTITTMTATGGLNGGNATPLVGGASGPPGNGSGGTVTNIAGNAGGIGGGRPFGFPGAGGAGVAGVNGGGTTGGGGIAGPGSGFPGNPGVVIFKYTP
jgi:hypothetical protein